MLKLLKNHVRTYVIIFQILNLDNILENLDQKVLKMPKKWGFLLFVPPPFFSLFWLKFSKILPKLNIYKATVPRAVSEHNFYHLNSFF